jgi:hypothetical protein
VIDEADDVILKDLKNFCNYSDQTNVKIICLTATPDDGDLEGIERKAFLGLGL